VILLVGFLLALAAAGMDLSRVTILASALGVGVGFGLQGIVNNFVSGLVLVFERPIQAGDIVQMGSLWGRVQTIGFRASIIRTFDGADIVVPNAELISQQVVNWSRSDQLRRMDVSVGVAYGTDPHLVTRTLLQVAENHGEILKRPQPEALFESFGDSSLNFTLRCWTHIEGFLRVRSEIIMAVNDAFQQAGIVIPFPQRDLRLSWSEPAEQAATEARPLRNEQAALPPGGKDTPSSLALPKRAKQQS
jgi:small-conductance mechanosensitive channel